MTTPGDSGAAGQPQYGAPPPGYTPPPQGYQPMPGAMGAGAVGTGPGGEPLADFGTRLLGGLIDYVSVYVLGIIFLILGHVIFTLIGVLLLVGNIAWSFYNAYLGGETGQSYGKKYTGTRVISEETGQPIGGGNGILRYLCHILDGFCLVGYIMSAFDTKRQTFADKIMKTVVVKV